MINFLREAQLGEKNELSFKIAYGELDSESEHGQVVLTDDGYGGHETESVRTISFDSLDKVYTKGHAMYLFAAMETSFFGAEYLFELIEKERKEFDILQDIITDMQEEIAEMKEKRKNLHSVTAMASWFTTQFSDGTHATLNGVHIEPTMEGMCHLSEDQQRIIIDLPGIYKIEAMVNFNSTSGNSGYLDIEVNGERICQKQGSQCGGFGTVVKYQNLNQNDYVQFYSNNLYGSSKLHSSFTIIKM